MLFFGCGLGKFIAKKASQASCKDQTKKYVEDQKALNNEVEVTDEFQNVENFETTEDVETDTDIDSGVSITETAVETDSQKKNKKFKNVDLGVKNTSDYYKKCMDSTQDNIIIIMSILEIAFAVAGVWFYFAKPNIGNNTVPAAPVTGGGYSDGFLYD